VKLIRSTVEPLLEDLKPPFIAAMGFQKLTLGELPLRLEGIRVVGGEQQGERDASDPQLCSLFCESFAWRLVVCGHCVSFAVSV